MPTTPEAVAEGGQFELLCCTWSRCGTYVVAGGNNCIAYMWHWNLNAPMPGWGVPVAEVQSSARPPICTTCMRC